MTFRRAAKTDDNHKQIVTELRKAGASVYNTHQLKGFCDICVGYKGMNYLMEIKDPNKPPSARRLTEREEEFHTTWRGQISVVHTTDEALDIINYLPYQQRIKIEKK